MKTWFKVAMIVLVCYVFYFFSLEVLNKTDVSNNVVEIISFICYLIPILFYIIIELVLYKKYKKENDIISRLSFKIKEVNEIFSSYNFEKIITKNRSIIEREYSRKSFDRVKAKDIIFYHFDNDIEGLLTDVKTSFDNKNKYDEFVSTIKAINAETPDSIITESGFSKEKFNKIENRIISKLINDKSYYNIIVNIKVCYRSPKGQVNVSKQGKYNYLDLYELYCEWNKGKSYATNIKVERAIMNDEIRYNVLRRDNYTCQICGASAKDGAKLHVDHIIPVSRGGKTIMTNLQTLCERCNKGKGNKTEDDFNNMVCPNCGSKLVLRKGKYGNFIGCSNYPKCHYKK